jgi:hypothetical protein
MPAEAGSAIHMSSVILATAGYLASDLDFFFSTLWARRVLYVSLNGSLQQIHLLSFFVLKTVEMLRSS